VPENLLRIELRVAKPLHAPLLADRVRLLDADGQQIEGAFLDLALPSADGRRLTLLLHPGRVKSGVSAHLRLGRALHAGSQITLLVDDPAIGEPVHKTWQVVAFDATSPVPRAWTVEAPRAASRTPLIVHLDAAISSTSQDLIAVRGADGKRVEGATTLIDSERTWRFAPTRPWRAGHYALMTHPELEDPAGNRICASFEAVQASRVACDGGAAASFSIAR
jgi:hypothetical protein